MKDPRKMFKYRFSAAMCDKKTNVAVMSDRLGLHEKTVYGYFYGGLPKITTLCEICEYLDVSADYLLGRTDKMEVNR